MKARRDGKFFTVDIFTWHQEVWMVCDMKVCMGHLVFETLTGCLT